MLANLINQHALPEAQAGNWAAVASTLNAQTITLEGLRISGKQTILGLVSLGRDPDAIRLILESTPSGRGLLDLLPSVGVNWVDPLTLAVLSKNTGDGKLAQADADALKSLSNRTASLASQQGLGTVTADQCQRAWLINSTLTPMRGRLNAIETWLTTQSVLDKSLADLQAFIADILSTPDGNPTPAEPG
jgi:hypothetical protein